MGQKYAAHEAVLAILQNDYVSGETVSSLVDPNEQRGVFQNISLPESTIHRLKTCEEFGNSNAIKNVSR